MKILKENRAAIFIVLPILILVLFRSFGTVHFKTDAKKWAGPSIVKTNILTVKQAAALTGSKLVINLDHNPVKSIEIQADMINLPADSLLGKTGLVKIRNHSGPVLIFSAETGVSARIWMILSQLGCKNVFILTDDTDNETFKSRFRPDTIARPEF